MVKNWLAVGIILLFVGIAIAPTINFNTVKASHDDDRINVLNKADGSTTNNGRIRNVTSFHTNLSGAKYWYVIKTDFHGQINITVDIHTFYTANGSSKNFLFILCNTENQEGYLYDMKALLPGVNPDYYFKAHMGPLNWSWQHENNNITHWGNEHTLINISTNVNPCYITLVSYTTERTMDVWVNTSANASFTTTQGTDVFAYDRYDFSGTINVGWKKGTIILNGQKEVTIKNRLFAWYTVWSVSTGFEFLKFYSPSGECDWKLVFDKKGQHLYMNQSAGFQKNLWWGPNGTWAFKINMMNMGLLMKNCPNVLLAAADILLPE